MSLPQVNDVAPADQTRWYRVFWAVVAVVALLGLGVVLHYVVTAPIVAAIEGQ